MKCPRCQQDNPSHAMFCLACGAPVNEAPSQARRYAELKDEIQRLRRSLSVALEQQTATAEILKVIARSPTDVQPVFDTIARNAARLCGGVYSTLYRVEGASIHFVGHHNFTPDQLDTWRRTFPRPVEGTGVPVQRVVRTGTVYRIGDPEAQDDTDTDALTRAGQQARGLQSLLIVPMFRQHEVIGAIGVTHRERNAFTDAHVELLKTFADQAVIAIENVRLFKELQSSNCELTTALDTQTATSDILRVISQSQTDVQPVFDAIVAGAVRLLRAYSGAMTRVVAGEDRARHVHEHRRGGRRCHESRLPTVAPVGGAACPGRSPASAAQYLRYPQRCPPARSDTCLHACAWVSKLGLGAVTSTRRGARCDRRHPPRTRRIHR